MRAALVVDVLIELMVRSGARACRASAVNTWPVFPATVVATDLSNGFTSLKVARVTYAYRYAGEDFQGTDEKPFWYDGSAKDHLDSHQAGTVIAVRVDPDNPAQSVFREPYLAELSESAT